MRRFLTRTTLYAAVLLAIILMREVPMTIGGHYATVPAGEIALRIVLALLAVFALGALIAGLEQQFSKFRSK